MGIVQACYVACNSLHFPGSHNTGQPSLPDLECCSGGGLDKYDQKWLHYLVSGGKMWADASVTYVTPKLYCTMEV